MQDRSSWPPTVQSIVAAAEAAAAEAASAEMQQQAEAAEAALETELDTLRTEQAAAMREASAALKARCAPCVLLGVHEGRTADKCESAAYVVYTARGCDHLSRDGRIKLQSSGQRRALCRCLSSGPKHRQAWI